MQNIEEAQETKVLDTSVPKQDPRQDQLNAKFSKERSLQQYYEDWYKKKSVLIPKF